MERHDRSHGMPVVDRDRFGRGLAPVRWRQALGGGHLRAFVTPVIRVQRLQRPDIYEATMLLSRAFESNPNHVAAFGPDRAHIRSLSARLFHPVLEGLLERGLVFGAYDADGLAGVGAVAQPGRCSPVGPEKARILAGLLSARRPSVPIRMLRWARAWARHEPASAHWHVGPIGVAPHKQGSGVGTALMQALCRHVDDVAGLGYLETDRFENVSFYERHGFVVSAQGTVLGVPNWYMTRRAALEREAAPD